VSILQGIRRKAGYYMLGKQLGSQLRNRDFINLADAVTVGIIFHDIDVPSFKSIQGFLKSLAADGKQIYAIGFLEAEEIPDFYLLRRGFDFFCLADINWFGKPEVDFIEEFIKMEFDLLINLSIDNLFSLEYIYAMSKARFKVSNYINGSRHADLIINIKERRDVGYLIEQISHYLSIINKKQ
jgi:hypothetical protein